MSASINYLIPLAVFIAVVSVLSVGCQKPVKANPGLPIPGAESIEKSGNPAAMNQAGENAIWYPNHRIRKDEATGWIALDKSAPRPELYATNDGGKTWETQALPIMKNSGISQFILSPPVFFNKQDGIITFKTVNSLLYITHDGGKNWTLVEEPLRKGSDGDLSWNFSIDKNYDPFMNGYITVNNIKWVTKDGGLSWTESK